MISIYGIIDEIKDFFDARIEAITKENNSASKYYSAEDNLYQLKKGLLNNKINKLYEKIISRVTLDYDKNDLKRMLVNFNNLSHNGKIEYIAKIQRIISVLINKEFKNVDYFIQRLFRLNYPYYENIDLQEILSRLYNQNDFEAYHLNYDQKIENTEMSNVLFNVNTDPSVNENEALRKILHYHYDNLSDDFKLMRENLLDHYKKMQDIISKNHSYSKINYEIDLLINELLEKSRVDSQISVEKYDSTVKYAEMLVEILKQLKLFAIDPDIEIEMFKLYWNYVLIQIIYDGQSEFDLPDHFPKHEQMNTKHFNLFHYDDFESYFKDYIALISSNKMIQFRLYPNKDEMMLQYLINDEILNREINKANADNEYLIKLNKTIRNYFSKDITNNFEESATNEVSGDVASKFILFSIMLEKIFNIPIDMLLKQVLNYFIIKYYTDLQEILIKNQNQDPADKIWMKFSKFFIYETKESFFQKIENDSGIIDASNLKKYEVAGLLVSLFDKQDLHRKIKNLKIKVMVNKTIDTIPWTIDTAKPTRSKSNFYDNYCEKYTEKGVVEKEKATEIYKTIQWLSVFTF